MGHIAAVDQEAVGPGRLRVRVRCAGGGPGAGRVVVAELLDHLGRPVDSAAAALGQGEERGELVLGAGLAGEWGLAVAVLGPEGMIEDEWRGRAELPAVPDLAWSVSPRPTIQMRDGAARTEVSLAVRRTAAVAAAPDLPVALEWWLVDGVRGEQVLGSGEVGLTSSQQAAEQAAWVSPFYGPALLRVVVKGPTRAAMWAERELAITGVQSTGGALRVNGDPFILKAVWLDVGPLAQADWREGLRRVRELGANAIWGELTEPWQLRAACEQGLMWVPSLDAAAARQEGQGAWEQEARARIRAHRDSGGILAWGCGAPDGAAAPELLLDARALVAAEDGAGRPCLAADALAPETVCWGRFSDLLTGHGAAESLLDPARDYRRRTMDVHAQLRTVSADGRTVRIALRNRRPYPLGQVVLVARIPGQESELPLAEPLLAGAVSTVEVACAYDVRGKAIELRVAHESHCGLADGYTLLCAVPRE